MGGAYYETRQRLEEESMDPSLWVWFICPAVPLAYYAGRWFLRWLARRRPPPPLTRAQRMTAGLPMLTRDQPTLERLVADLTRLERDFQRIEASDAPHRAQRMQMVSLAYDDVLCECCRTLGLPEPTTRPLDPVDRIQTQCELARHGLTW
ncbi:MAG: hypothetical protein WBG57_02385 [Ornithinimicrobium sp.]